MNTLSIDKKEVLAVYNQTNDAGKKILEKLFGDHITLNITGRVKTFKDACQIKGIDPSKALPQLPVEMDSLISYVQAGIKLAIIAEALNEGWKPNWEDEDEYKYYPWFYMNASEFRLNYVDCRYTDSYVGSRLCFRTSELAEYAANQFTELYRALYLC